MTDTDRYMKAAKKVQTAIEFSKDKIDQEPKHLRVGIDMSKSDMAGLARLLIEKGVFTEEEYVKAIADQAEIEASDRQKEISEEYGREVTLSCLPI